MLCLFILVSCGGGDGGSDTFVLNTDIDLSGINNWEPIKNFKGNLDGQDHKITGLKIDSTNDENIGLFRTVSGTIENLVIENATVSAKGKAKCAGILAGQSTGTIKNVKVSGIVNTPYYDSVGGIVGISDVGLIIGSENNATVSGANMTGGIAGFCTGAIKCQNSFEVISTTQGAYTGELNP